jgi:Ca2+-binding RTX toxin-like protein
MPFTFGSPETRVNTTTAGAQNFSAVVDIPGRGYVVVWQSPGAMAQFPDAPGVFGQCYDYQGRPIGSEFVVAANPVTGGGFDPAVTSFGEGYFMVTFTAFDGFSTGVYGRNYSFGGFAFGPEFQISGNGQASQEEQQVARLGDGSTVVTWTASSSEPAQNGVFARRYDSSGVAMGPEFEVSTGATNFASFSAVTATGTGYVVAWSATGNSDDVFMQRFALDGTPLGGETPVNATTAESQRQVSLASLADGGFVAVWISSAFNQPTEIHAQRYDADGTKVGGEILITDSVAATASRPDVTGTADGGFAVSFESGFQVMLRSYDAAGEPLGIAWPIAEQPETLQSRPATALLSDGSLLVSWHNGDIYAARIRSGDFLTDGVDRAMGTQDSDYMEGFGGDDILRGGDGDDLLEGGLGADRLIGGEGNDEATYASAIAGISINLQTGGHTGEAAGDTFEQIEQFSLSRFGDRFIGGSGVDRVYGLAGDDQLIGGGGADRLDGGDGNDVLEGGLGADILIGGAGEDEASYIRDSQGLGIDLSTGVRSGAAAGDSYSSIERFTLTRFNDSFTGSNLAERVSGGIGNDVLNGAGGDDQLDGGAGNDSLDGGSGLDILAGGAGDDSYFLDAGDVVIEALGEGFDIVYARSSLVLSPGAAVEVLGTVDNMATTALSLTGNELDNYVTGNAGANTLDGGAGGFDTLWGRDGDDSYLVDAGDVVIEYAGQGYDIVYSWSNHILAAGFAVEVLATGNNMATTAINLTGNELDNYVTGNAGANTLDGGGGSDVLWGREGDDSYLVDGNDIVMEYAGQGNDIVYARSSYALGAGVWIEMLGTVDNTATAAIDLTGNELANFVTGNAGANVLNGGAGADQLFGRGGADTFAFTTALGGGNVDAILDFVSGADRIALDDAIFAGIGGPGGLNANTFVLGSAAQDANDRIVYNSTTGQLFYDADGNGAGGQVLFAMLQSSPALTASDFIMI